MNLEIIKPFFLVCVLSILMRVGLAQPKCKIEHYSTEDGLSHDRVTCMMKDKEGFMWFGSWDGINRFDGRNFVSYKSSPGDMARLKNDRIDQIVEDQSNHLWLKAYDGDIYRFDKRSEQFLPLSEIVSTSKKRIAFDRIYQTNDGDIWLVSVQDGLFYFPKQDTTLRHFLKYGKESFDKRQLPSNKINFLLEDREHHIWIGTPEGLAFLNVTGQGYKVVSLTRSVFSGLNFTAYAEGEDRLFFGTANGQLISYNKQNQVFSAVRVTENSFTALLFSKKRGCVYASTSAGELLTLNPKDQKIISLKIYSSGSLNSIFEDSNGFLWLSPEKQGAVRFNPLSGIFQFFSQKNDALHNNTGNHYRVFEDNKGIVWVSMKSGGFGYYNALTNKLEYFYNEPGSANRQLSNAIIDMYYDKANVIWINTDERGIDKISLLSDGFRQHLLVDQPLFKTDNEVRGILCDKLNRVWLGVKSGKLYIYQNNRLVNNLFVNEPKDGFGQIYTIKEDHLGNIWLGTKNNGLFKAEPLYTNKTKYRLTHFLSNKEDPNTLSSNEVYAILEDKNGKIWIGTYDEGLNLLRANGKTVQFIHGGHEGIQYPKGSFNKIRNLNIDEAGNIWVASTDGLLILGRDNGKVSSYKYITYRKVPGDIQSLGTNDIQYIYRDSKNNMWLGTSGGGLDRVLGKNPFQSLRFKNYTTKDGLPNDYVLSCTEDRNGNLWVGTQNGLAKFNIADQQFTNYDSYNGLPKTMFSEASATRSSNHNLLFGTVNGYLLFDPESIINHKTNAKLVFTNLQINNADVFNGSGDKILTSNINYLPDLKLRYNQNTISLDYTVLDPRSGLKVNYAYRLKGLDNGWQNNKTQRRITYTNLAPGNYTLEIKSTSANLFSNIPYRALNVIIFPPIWQTWWAFVLYAMVMVLIVVLIARTALTMLRLRHNISVEQRLSALKLSFFTNVSHELRTPLTLILNPIEEIEKIFLRDKTSNHGLEYAGVIKNNANRMVRFINQLLDLRKAESGKITLKISQLEVVSFIKNIGEYFSHIGREKKIDLQFIFEPEEIIAWADAEKLDIVIYNVLANAFKFTPSNKLITVKINEDTDQGNIIITISDQGEGVEPADLKHIFELYYEGERSNATYLKGTGIGLALSKELIELHHGKISAENNPDQGLAVTIVLKTGKEHFANDDVDFIDQPVINHQPEKAITELSFALSNPELRLDEQIPLVLLVEDNNELRTFLSIQLSEYYRVITAKNGAEGLETALTKLPELILSDVMMPVMSGIEMLDRLKNNSATSHIPVVLLSAKFSVESQIEGLNYGADYYITKPFHNDFLLASIQNLLNKRKKIFEQLLADKKVVHLSPGEIAITTHDEKFLKRIIEIVEENMSNADFNVDSAAELMNMSRSPFFKKFKSLTNQAPVEFVREMRLKRAKQLFDLGQTKISDISFEVGFSNSKYFSTCFKEQFGVTPSEYLKTKERSNTN